MPAVDKYLTIFLLAVQHIVKLVATEEAMIIDEIMVTASGFRTFPLIRFIREGPLSCAMSHSLDTDVINAK